MMVEHSPKILASEEKATTTFQHLINPSPKIRITSPGSDDNGSKGKLYQAYVNCDVLVFSCRVATWNAYKVCQCSQGKLLILSFIIQLPGDLLHAPALM